jgi:hypothetical protein
MFADCRAGSSTLTKLTPECQIMKTLGTERGSGLPGVAS